MKDDEINKDKEIRHLKEPIKKFERSETERKQAEENTQQRQNKFLNSVLESLTHPFYVIDARDYTIKMANSAARQGSSSEDATCYALTHKRSSPCTATEHPCPLKEVKKTKKPIVLEHIHYDKSGNPRNVEISAFPILDENGNVIQIIEYSLDITKHRQAEEELQRLKEELEKKVDEKTKELRERISELERFHEATVDRELRMKELRDKIEELEKKLKGK